MTFSGSTTGFKLLLVAVAYFLFGRLGLTLPYNDSNFTLVWLPTGLAVAALMRWGYRCWPGILLGALVTNYSVDATFWLDSNIALGNTLAPLFTVWLLRRFGFNSALDSAHDILVFIGAATLGMLLSASAGVGSLLLFNVIRMPEAGAAWLSWWVSDFSGVLLIAPILLSISRAGLQALRTQGPEFLVCCLVLIGVSVLVFYVREPRQSDTPDFVFIVFPFTVWAAMRFGVLGAALARLLPAGVAIAATSQGQGPFYSPLVQDSSFMLWLYLATLVFVDLTVAALQAARKKSEANLRRISNLYAALSQCNQAIVRCTNEAELFPQICRDVVKFGGMKMAWIGLLDADTQRVKPVSSAGVGIEYLDNIQISVSAAEPTGRGLIGLVMREDHPIWCQDYLNEASLQLWHERGMRSGWRSSAAIPLHKQGKVVGVLVLYSGELNAFDEPARNLLLEMASDIDYALNSYHLQDERIRIDQALADSNRLLNTIIESAPIRIFWKDKDLNYLGGNTHFARDAGFETPQQLIGKDDFQMSWKTQAELYRADDSLVLTSGIDKLNYEEPLPMPDGSIFWVRTSKVQLRNEAQEIIGILGLYEDITARKKVEDSLLESDKRLRLALDAASMGVWEYDFTTRKLYWSPEICKYFQVQNVESFQDLLRSSVHPEDLPIYQEAMRRAIKEHVPYFAVYRLIVNGCEYWAEDHGDVIYDERGQPLKVIGTAQNVTTRKLAEEAYKRLNSELEQRVQGRTAQLVYANSAKDSFLATMSHEIRTPLSGMMGMLELLGLTHLDSDQRATLQVAGQSGQSLLRIVDDILDLSKIEAGKLQLAPRPSSLVGLVRGVENTYSQLAKAKSIQLLQQVDPQLTELYLLDPLRVSQILNNFTSNAIKFTAQGAVRIVAQLLARQEGRVMVRLSVIDSGAGIDQQHQARLFQHYEQASADTARMYGGTGLGLSICRSLAEMMDATIQVDSSPGMGSTFSLTLDLEVVALQSDHGASPIELPDHIQLQTIEPLVKVGETVSLLIVDDHPVNRLLLKQQLGLLGFQVEAAADGVEAMALWREGKFALLITDCHMPQMDGYALTKAIRSAELGGGKRVPILAWTANVLVEEAEHCRHAGMDDILTKPTDLSKLRSKLEKWLPQGVASQPDELRVNTASADVAVLEMQVLEKFSTQLKEQAELLRAFDRQNQIDLDHLHAAVQSGEMEAAQHAAHRVKGASRMLGAQQLEHICARIQAAAALEDVAEVRRLIAVELDDAVLRFRRVMQSRMLL